MPPGTIALHVFGGSIWFAGIMTALHAMRGFTAAEVRGDFAPIRGSIGRIMDVGATMSLISGGLLLTTPSGQALLSVGAMHAKLAIVVGLLGVHGLIRVMLARYSRGEVSDPKRFLVPVCVISYFLIIWLIEVRPF